MPAQEDWNTYLVHFQELHEHPVVFTWRRK
jgi:hypothetical protein